MDEALADMRQAMVEGGYGTESEVDAELRLFKARAVIAAKAWSQAEGREVKPSDWIKRLGLRVEVRSAQEGEGNLAQAMYRAREDSVSGFVERVAGEDGNAKKSFWAGQATAFFPAGSSNFRQTSRAIKKINIRT